MEATSVYFSACVIVILLDDGGYKRPKHVVEDKLMHSVKSVVFVW
jgi:hypothetical protein